MGVAEILEELPKLSEEDRYRVFQRLAELGSEETPAMLAAIDEADRASFHDDLSAEQMRQDVSRWARTK
jgi:hypothetical protein